MKKVTWAQYYQFLKDYDNNVYANQRMGQAFMNKFNINNDQKLFYYQMRKETTKRIVENYIDHESK